MGAKHHRNCPSPCSMWTHLTHQCLDRPHHLPKRRFDRFMHFHTTKQQRPHWLQWDAPAQLHPQTVRPSTITTPSNTHIPRPHYSPSQTTSGSTQQFCHSTLSGPTNKPTNRWSRQMFRTMSAHAQTATL